MRQASGRSLSPRSMERFIQAFSEAGNMEAVKEAWEFMKKVSLRPSQVKTNSLSLPSLFISCHLVRGGRLCYFLDQIIWHNLLVMILHTLVIGTHQNHLCWTWIFIYFLKTVESGTPDPYVMEWSCPGPLCWVRHLAHPNSSPGTLPNRMGRGAWWFHST